MGGLRLWFGQDEGDAVRELAGDRPTSAETGLEDGHACKRCMPVQAKRRVFQWLWPLMSWTVVMGHDLGKSGYVILKVSMDL